MTSKSQLKRFAVQEPQSLVERLRKRAEIRRNIPRSEPDRISDILEEAANRIKELEEQIDWWHEEDRK